MPHRGVSILLLVSALAACQATLPEGAMRMSPELLAERQLETRRFDNVDEEALLAACAGLMQDLGFTIDESDSELGLIIATKNRRAEVSPGMRIAQLLALFAEVEFPVDRKQRIHVSLVTTPVESADRSFQVRVTFQRIVWDTENEISRRERLNDPELYQRFFEQLSKSVFLEAQSV